MRVALLALLFLRPGAALAQPHAARTPVRLPVAAVTLADALHLASPRPSTVLLDTIRLVYTSVDAPTRQRATAALTGVLAAPAANDDRVPLPLDAAVWRDRILGTPVKDETLVSAIIHDRTAALMFLGLSALDDDTLTWLAANPETLRLLKAHPAAFAAFGRSLHVRRGALAVPGGDEAEPLWRALTGPDAAPAAVIARLFAGDCRTAFLFDTIAHLDAPRQRFALGLYLPAPLRQERMRGLMRAVSAAAPEWRADERPFARPPLDVGLLLSTIAVLPDGSPVGPDERRLWERVFRADALAAVPFEEITRAEIDATSGAVKLDAAWLAANVLDVPYGIGRRRLDVLLFAQRVFGSRSSADVGSVATALRAYEAFPALTLALERAGIGDPGAYATDARRAASLSAIRSVPARRTAIAAFQSAIALIVRMRRSGVLTDGGAAALIASLAAVDTSARDGYEGRFVRWFRDEFVPALPTSGSATIDDRVLAAVAGVRGGELPQVTWEDRAYLVDPSGAELRRLRRVRGRQGGRAVDASLGDDATLSEALVAIVYAMHLGDPDGAGAMAAGVAARHELGLTASGSLAAWALPLEEFDKRAGWRLRGSLLGIETALGGLTLRRINATEMPQEPSLAPPDRQALALAAALFEPAALTDESRDGIAAAVARGGARVGALQAGSDLEPIARDAALSEWRRQALEWDLARGASDVRSRFSLLELLWLGSPPGGIPASWDGWGAAALARTGCLCLAMPRPRPFEDDAGYAVALLGTRAADPALRIALELADRHLPPAIAPALAGYTIEDVLDHARLSRPDDWEEFGRAARDLPRERLADYIAALAAGGPLVSVTKDESDRRNP